MKGAARTPCLTNMPPKPAKIAKAAVAALILSQLVLCMFMAASPSLHEDCHNHDHDHGNNECVVEIMLSGGYGFNLPSVTPVDVTPLRPLPDASVTAPVKSIPGHLIGLLLTYAPPRGP